MRYLTANIALALIWVVTTGSFSGASFLAGLVIGFVCLALGQPAFGRSTYFIRIVRVLSFVGYFSAELIRANLRIARAIFTPLSRLQAAVLAVPLEARTDLEIALLANLISLTPGSLTLDLAEDRSALYVHVLFTGETSDVRHSITQGLERRLLEILR